jgi:hypothetical protein
LSSYILPIHYLKKKEPLIKIGSYAGNKDTPEIINIGGSLEAN